MGSDEFPFEIEGRQDGVRFAEPIRTHPNHRLGGKDLS
jgi:hypothetical protein